MKKFTFMLLAAFIAVTAMAAGPQKREKTLNANAVVTSSVKQVTPKTKAVKVAATVADKLTQKAKAGVKKAPKKAGIMDLLTADLMLCSNYYEYDSDAEGLVPSLPTAGGWPIEIGEIDQNQLVTDLTTTGSAAITINGFTSSATEAVDAQISLAVPEEAVAEGVIAVLTIANGQTLLTSDYGTVGLKNASSDDDITAYVYSDGSIIFNDLWIDILLDGNYEGYLWSGYYYYSMIAPVNGAMTWGDTTVPVVLFQDPEDPKYVTMYNFGGFESAVDVTMKDDNKFAIETQFIASGGSTYGDFYTYAAVPEGPTSGTISGTGTENTLTFDTGWTLFSTNRYWYGYKEPATITLGMGEFVYPEIPDVAAVPAAPAIAEIGNYDAEKGYGYVLYDVPVTDVDGNELKESKLFYQFFADTFPQLFGFVGKAIPALVDAADIVKYVVLIAALALAAFAVAAMVIGVFKIRFFRRLARVLLVIETVSYRHR